MCLLIQDVLPTQIYTLRLTYSRSKYVSTRATCNMSRFFRPFVCPSFQSVLPLNTFGSVNPRGYCVTTVTCVKCSMAYFFKIGEQHPSNHSTLIYFKGIICFNKYSLYVKVKAFSIIYYSFNLSLALS